MNCTHAQQVGICRHNTDNARIDKNSGTTPVILAMALTLAPWWWFQGEPKHVGAAFTFLMCFSNPTIYIIECISWTIKYLILLIIGATMNIQLKCSNVLLCSIISRSISQHLFYSPSLRSFLASSLPLLKWRSGTVWEISGKQIVCFNASNKHCASHYTCCFFLKLI